MKEYEEPGHMQLVSGDGGVDGKETFYLPHHPVFKHDSSSTRLRVVFNASAKSTNGQSLNDTLLIGPTIQQDLFSILLRFRTYEIAFTADIEKMYWQIGIHLKDRAATHTVESFIRYTNSSLRTTNGNIRDIISTLFGYCMSEATRGG
jgi:hypothetical protein